MPRGTFLSCCCQCPHPGGELFLTHASTGGIPTLAGSFGSVSCGGHCSFALGLGVHKVLFVPSKTGVSLFPPVLSNQVRFPGDCQSLCQIPKLGSLSWGSEPSQQWENFFGGIVLQVVGHPTGGYWVWFCRELASPTIFLWLLLCLWTWGIFFLVHSSILLSMIVQQLVAILVLLQEEMSAKAKYDHLVLLSERRKKHSYPYTFLSS